MLTAILWLAMLADRHPLTFAKFVIVAGPVEMTHGDARWWADNPFRAMAYVNAAWQVGAVHDPYDVSDLFEYANGDCWRRLAEVRWSHGRLAKNLGRVK